MYGSLKPAGYVERHVDVLVERYLRAFGGIEIRGPRWCGKSWTSQAFGESITRVDRNADLFEDDPTLALQGAQPHVIDEWQDVVPIWNEARHAIDDSANRAGQFILTGSSSPLVEGKDRRHSGAGRIARVDMGTMTLCERGVSTRSVSLKGLFEGKFKPSPSSLGIERLAQLICQGGWPAVVVGTSPDAAAAVDGYLAALFEESIPRAGKSGELARLIAQSLARNVGTSATLGTISQDASAGEDVSPSEATVRSYLEEFKRNYFVFELPAWDAPVRSRSRVRSRPKRYFADTSLVSSLLGLNSPRLFSDGQLFGILFESLAVHDVGVYVSLLPGAYPESLRYYGDADGLEVDMIIELRDGSWAGIEVKSGVSGLEKGVRSLQRLRRKVAKNPQARNPEPVFMAVLMGSYPYARYLKDEDVYVIPIETLCP